MWRLSRDDLVSHGFDMKHIDTIHGEPSPSDSHGLHINILEFIAIIINVWITLKLILRLPTTPGGHIVNAISDNTSALSWMQYAARSHAPPIRRLSRLMNAFFLFNTAPTRLQSSYIPGQLNTEADLLSRFTLAPTWDSVISQIPPLATCQPYHIPRKLLSVIANTVTSTQTEATFDVLTTRLLTLELHTLPKTSDLTSAPLHKPRRGKRSR